MRRRKIRRECEGSLATFIRLAWPTIEPGQPYIHGWHIDAIAQHLEAVTAGEITRLLINVPPGAMKSLAVGVFWPAWEWGPKGLPHMRYLGTAHNHTLAIRDNQKMRRLVASEWYQELWGDGIRLMSDQNAKLKFENDATGFREAMAFTGLTGSRGDRVLIDDPLSVYDAQSDAKREEVNETFREAVPTRLNNPDASAIVVVMQRLHENDVAGLILAKDFGYEHLMLPMEFEPERRCVTSIGFSDPRTKDGELLFPERFPQEVVERDKKVMGSYATAGQFQQRPAPREGGLFKRSWFDVVPAAPVASSKVRRWDLASTEAAPGTDPDWLVGLRLSELEGTFFVEHIVRTRVDPAGVEKTLKQTADADGTQVPVAIPQDPGAAGKAYAAALIKKLVGYTVRAEIESGDKFTRALPVSAQAEAGNVKLVVGEWNEAFLDELCVFPNGKHDDQVDALSGAFNFLLNGTPSSLEYLRQLASQQAAQTENQR